MVRFIRNSFFFLIPLVLLFAIPVSTFYIMDPFKVLYHQDEFTNSIVDYDVDYVDTERYLNHPGDYDSFVFGSSRSGYGFQIDEWKKYLPDTARPFSYSAGNESIFGIIGKIRLIDELGGRMDNVLMVIDTELTLQKLINSHGHLVIKHPRVSHESRSAFIAENLKDYIFTGFFIRYLDYMMFGVHRPYMDGYLVLEDNEIGKPFIPFDAMKLERKIAEDKDKYYSKVDEFFYERPEEEQVSERLIYSSATRILRQIKEIFDKHNTNYKIVISPMYTQIKMNSEDLKILNQIFDNQVYDFSGKNEMTEDKYNFYESMHFRKHIGDQIMEEIYTEN